MLRIMNKWFQVKENSLGSSSNLLKVPVLQALLHPKTKDQNMEHSWWIWETFQKIEE